MLVQCLILWLAGAHFKGSSRSWGGTTWGIMSWVFDSDCISRCQPLCILSLHRHCKYLHAYPYANLIAIWPDLLSFLSLLKAHWWRHWMYFFCWMDFTFFCSRCTGGVTEWACCTEAACVQRGSAGPGRWLSHLYSLRSIVVDFIFSSFI